jgi:hypothetical protein
MLASYGANYDILREAYIIEAKLSYLNSYLYGANGEKISNAVIDEYYKANYYRFKHVFFYTYDMLCETDADGNDIYYVKDSQGKIAYNTSAKKRRDDAGKEVIDKNGDIVYENDDGSIAYDKKNGQRQPIYDENGYVMTRDYTKEELIKVSDHATLIMEELEDKEGNYTLFDSYVEKYSEDEGSTKYANGIYLTEETNYSSPEVLKAVIEMEDGEIRQIHSEYGIHIVMKYELEESGYAIEDNEKFFVGNQSGNYIFMGDLIDKLYADYLEKYLDMIEVKEKLLKGIDMKSVEANYDF